MVVALRFAPPGWGSALLARALGGGSALGALLVPKDGDVGVHTVCGWSACLRGCSPQHFMNLAYSSSLRLFGQNHKGGHLGNF